MKYDPIMCMMVDDSVKTKDGLYDPEKNAGYEIKKEGQYFKIYKNGKLVGMKSTEEEAAREAARHRAANDSKTIDHAIRSCDISMYEKIYQEAKAAVGGKYGIISNLSDLETAINDANRRGEKEDAKKLKAIYKKYY